MSSLQVWAITLLGRTYASAALVAAAVLSPAALSFAPILLLVWHLYAWWRPPTPALRLLTDFFLFFAIALSLTTRLGPFISLLIALPMLALVTLDLQEAAARPAYLDSRFRRSPTRIGTALPIMTIVAIVVSWLLGSLALLVSSAAALAYFGILVAVALRQLPRQPVEEVRVQLRLLAGTPSELDMKLNNKTNGGMLILESPHPWLKISPSILSLKEELVTTKMALTPPLSGPSLIKISGQATDRWGLTQVKFDIEPLQLQVVPRARRAEWLARKYLAESSPGNLPLVSNVGTLKPMYGLRRGVEYYGSRQFQPGDSIKYIDWKHSAVHREIIVKEFAEFQGQSAVVLANLAVGDAEEADQIASKVIVTALSLAGSGIPTALAAYDHRGVKLATSLLEPRQLVIRSLQLAMETVTIANPERHLHPPNVARLRANMERTRSGKSEASRVLAQLLQIEYRNLDAAARHHPATNALRSTLAKVDSRCNIVVISQHNHDAEALAFNTFIHGKKGRAVINV